MVKPYHRSDKTQGRLFSYALRLFEIAVLLPLQSIFRFQRSHIDGESVLHIRPDQTLVGFVDLLDGDDLHIGGDVVLAAEVEHLLGLFEAADDGTGEAAAAEQQGKGRYLERFLRGADQGDVAVTAKYVDVGVDVVIDGNGIEDEVERTRVLLHLIRIGGNDDLIRTQAECILLLAWRSGEDRDPGAESL